MADKSVGELIAARSVTPTDLFVLEQNGTAKKLTGQILENWLVSFADGHGGIQSIVKLSTSGLADTYRITLADTTTFDFVVTNGRGITGISQTSTIGLVDTYTISYNDSTSDTFTVTNGTKGDTGDNAYIWVKYASQEPTSDDVSLGDIPDDWMGVYFGTSDTAPTSYSEYRWYQIKGEKGNSGDPATLVSAEVTYQVGDSGTIIPSGSWSTSIPMVAQGKYLWTKIVQQYNTGDPITAYSVTRMGIDGSGSVSSVADISPDANGNVPLTAADVEALPIDGGDMEGPVNMNGQSIRGLNNPTADDQAANRGYVDQLVRKAAPRNLLDNADFRNPVNQRGITTSNAAGYTIDRWVNPTYIRPKWTVNDGYVSLENDLTDSYRTFQRLTAGTLKAGTRYTAAAKIHNGNVFSCVLEAAASGDRYSGRLDDSFYLGISKSTDYDAFYLSIVSGGAPAFEWVALYEGEYTAETLPEFHSRGYEAELAACMRYFQVIKTVGNEYLTPMGFGYAASQTAARCSIPLVSAMRDGVNGSIEKNTFTAMSVRHGTTLSTVTDLAVLTASTRMPTNGIILTCTASGLTTNAPVVLVATGGELWISKDL